MGLQTAMDTCAHQTRRTLLVIDSNESTRKVLNRVLSSKFEEVHTAKSFVEAIRITRDIEITHLVTAFVFEKEGVNGFEVGAYLRSSRSKIQRVIVFTGADVSDLTIPDGIDAVVFKPAGLEELTDVLCR